MRAFGRNPLTWVSLAFLILIALFAVFAPHVTRFSYEEQNLIERLQTPNFLHWMGTDILGRDLYSRIIYGARMSLAVGISATLFSLIIGTTVGLCSGYFGGWIDHLLMRAVDLLTIFPSILLAILFMMVFGRGFTGICLGLGLTAWVTQARLVRGQVLLIRELSYVESALALGLSSFRIMFKHILPNLWGPILVSLTIQVPTHIMSESFLSFLGLGLQPPYSSWGTLANEGFRAMQSYPYLMIFPGLVLFMTLLGFHYVGEGLKEVFHSRIDQRLSV